MPDNVTQGVSCIRYIKSFQQPVFNEAQVSVMVKALESGKRDSTLTTHYERLLICVGAFRCWPISARREGQKTDPRRTVEGAAINEVVQSG
jgi:hypothetical protein